MVWIILACIISLSPARAWAGAGAIALPFLKIDSGARASALGGAYSAAGEGASSIFYNPAGAALSDRKEFEISHNDWLEGLRNENLAYTQPISKNHTVFGGANLLFSGTMDKYNASGVKTGSFNSQEGAFNFGVSTDLGDQYYCAAALKALYQKADKDSANSWAGDAGLLKISGDLRFGASVSNFGTKMKLGSRAFDLPLILRAGAGKRLNDQFWFLADIVKVRESQAAFCAGVEAGFDIDENEAFFARAGYKSDRSQYTGSGLTAGIGIKSNNLRLDYAFAPYGDLGDSHRITLSFRFGVMRENIPVKNKYPSGQDTSSRQTPAAKDKTPTEKKTANEQEDEGILFVW